MAVNRILDHLDGPEPIGPMELEVEIETGHGMVRVRLAGRGITLSVVMRASEARRLGLGLLAAGERAGEEGEGG